MKITFVVPELNLTGGLRVISIYAELLAKKGHKVSVVSPNRRMPNIREKIKLALNWKGFVFNSNFNHSFFDGANYGLKILDVHRAVTNEDVTDADIVIATFWNTAEWVADLSSTKGKKVYFIQHYEIHPWMPIKRVKDTLRLPFKKIVVAQWLADILKDQYQQDNVSVISNAVDHQLFYAPSRKKNATVIFGMMYSSRQYKGSQLAFDCFNELRKKIPAIQLVVFGLEVYEEVVGLPEGAEYYSQPNQDEIREIYSQCDVWLFTSSLEGFGLPILEAMVCRTPVIGTRCGAAPDLLKSGGGILINIDSKEELLLAMTSIYELTSEEWLNLSNRAFKEAGLHNWEDKAVQFEHALLVHD